MDMVPRSWYIQEETIRKIGDWGSISTQFFTAFSVMVEALVQKEALLIIKDFIFHRSAEECHTKSHLRISQVNGKN
jgi:hypothetical protein